MAAEAISTIINKAKLPARESYYRSQLYTAYLGINPLVTAAHPLFSIIERIKFSPSLSEPSALLPRLEHELMAFCARAQNENYDEESILISRYLLSTVVEEIIQLNQQKNIKLKLSADSKNKKSEGEPFFEVLSRLINKPEHYLDLLELIYLCLNCGYQGKYLIEENKSELKKITDDLYQVIHSQRVHVRKKKKPQTTVLEIRPRSPIGWKKITLLSAASLLLGLIASHVIINYNADTLLNKFSPSVAKSR